MSQATWAAVLSPRLVVVSPRQKQGNANAFPCSAALSGAVDAVVERLGDLVRWAGFERMFTMLQLIVLLFAVHGLAWGSSEYVGRWDVTEQAGGREYAAWMEITQEGAVFKGRVVPRSGHARPATVTIQDGRLQVTVERYRAGSGATPTYIGRIENDALKGSGKDSRGRDLTWTGVRAPDRLEGSDRNVEWGEPIQLFNGRDLSGWETIGSRRTNNWKAIDGVLTNENSGANIRTSREFRDFKLRLECKVPEGSNPEGPL